MAADEDDYIVKEPGRLIYAATGQTISIASTPTFPHGGTSLGYTEAGFELDDRVGSLYPLSGEDRRRPFDYLMVGDNELVLTVDLLQWDADSVALAFPGVFSTASTKTGANRLVNIPSSFEDGALASTIARQALFVPDNTRDGTYIYFPAAVIWPDERRRMLKRSTVKSVPLVLRALQGTLPSGAVTHLLHGDLRDIAALV